MPLMIKVRFTDPSYMVSSARMGGSEQVIDGASFPQQGYAPVGAQLAESAAPAPPAQAQATPQSAPEPDSGVPACVPDFSSGLSGGYVLEWLEPTTHAVLVQLPMRTALAQFAELDGGSAGQVGRHLDTAV